MTSRETSRERLERLAGRALRELPPRRAPPGLDERVLREIARRELLPWWRRGFAAWPLAARGALLLSCCGSAAVVVLGSWSIATRLAMSGIEPIVARRLEALRNAGEAAEALLATARNLIRLIPSGWLLGGLVATALLYALLFALIAVGYCTLYAAPGAPGGRST